MVLPVFHQSRVQHGKYETLIDLSSSLVITVQYVIDNENSVASSPSSVRVMSTRQTSFTLWLCNSSSSATNVVFARGEHKLHLLNTFWRM